MLQWIVNYGTQYTNNSLQAALADWCILALHFGFRLSEFLQTQDNISNNTIQLNRDGKPQAFISNDIQMFGSHKQMITLDHQNPKNDEKIQSFSITWRYQKNQQNGETKLITRNTKNPTLCPVLAMIRILNRAVTLKIPPGSPLAVYQTHKNSFTLISH